MDPDEIANRFSRAFPDATFEVRQPDIDDDYHYEINVINGPLDRDDVERFETDCEIAGIDVTVYD